MALLLPVTAATQDGDREPLAGVPGILSLPTTHPWGLNQMVVKHAGFTTAPPAPAFGNTGTPDFSESALLGGASGLDIDGFSVGLDWILADANGQVPPPGSVAAPWSWAGFIFSPGHSLFGPPTAQHAAIANERLTRPDNAGADLFLYILRGSVLPGTTVALPGPDVRLIADSPEINLYTGNPNDSSAIDAYDLFAFFYLNSEFAPYLPQPPRAYFTISAASVGNIPPSWNIAAASQSGATIFTATWQGSGWSTPTVYRSPASLGLQPSADIDALAVDTLRLAEHNNEHYVLFSLDPNVFGTPIGPGTGISFARSGAFGFKTEYKDPGGEPIDEHIGRSINIRAICDLDPSRDLRFPPNVGLGKPPPFLPWVTGTTRSVAWRDYMGGCDMVRTLLWSNTDCSFGQTTHPAAFVLMEETTLQSIGPIFVLPNQRGGGIGSGAWRGCPATIDFDLPPGIDQYTVNLAFFWADLNPGPPLAITTPLPKGMRF